MPRTSSSGELRARRIARQSSIPGSVSTMIGWGGARSRLGYSLRKCKRDDGVARAERTTAARRDDDELPPASLVGHRCGTRTRGQVRLPQLAARLDVEGANRVLERRADEDNSPGGNDRPAEVQRSR